MVRGPPGRWTQRCRTQLFTSTVVSSRNGQTVPPTRKLLSVPPASSRMWQWGWAWPTKASVMSSSATRPKRPREYAQGPGHRASSPNSRRWYRANVELHALPGCQSPPGIQPRAPEVRHARSSGGEPAFRRRSETGDRCAENANPRRIAGAGGGRDRRHRRDLPDCGRSGAQRAPGAPVPPRRELLCPLARDEQGPAAMDPAPIGPPSNLSFAAVSRARHRGKTPWLLPRRETG